VRARRRFMRHRLAVVSLVILVIVFVAGILASYLAPHGYDEININALSKAPSWAHPFGTDQIGHDYFSRTLLGLRTEVEIVLIVGLVGTVIGTALGAAAGYLGGFTDSVVMRLVDLLLTVPPLVTVLVAAAFLHTDTLSKTSLLLAGLLWMPVARAVRSATLVVREQEYIQAALAMGSSDMRIIRRHVLPNVVGAAAVAASVLAASVVILETTLSFLGLGRVAFGGGRTDAKLASVGDVLASAQNEGCRAAAWQSGGGLLDRIRSSDAVSEHQVRRPEPERLRHGKPRLRHLRGGPPRSAAERARRRPRSGASTGLGRAGRTCRREGRSLLACVDGRRRNGPLVGVLLRHQRRPRSCAAWYTCTSSTDGRHWAKPVRAARDAASPDVLWEDARVYPYGDVIGYGGTTSVVAGHGSAHPLWIDTRDLGGRKQEVFGATLP
jgi:ABC-type dipeptide/oligopeptide/nickel transport system permease subunit